jgi:hypothetical protein
MNHKFLIRLAACALVFCLLANSGSTGSATVSVGARPFPPNGSVFDQEALAPRVMAAPEGANITTAGLFRAAAAEEGLEPAAPAVEKADPPKNNALVDLEKAATLVQLLYRIRKQDPQQWHQDMTVDGQSGQVLDLFKAIMPHEPLSADIRNALDDAEEGFLARAARIFVNDKKTFPDLLVEIAIVKQAWSSGHPSNTRENFSPGRMLGDLLTNHGYLKVVIRTMADIIQGDEGPRRFARFIHFVDEELKAVTISPGKESKRVKALMPGPNNSQILPRAA